MKFKVFPNSEIQEREVYFKLEEDAGEIDLTLVNSRGDMIGDGFILSIERDGRLFLYSGIDEDSGLNLNKDGRLRISNA